MKEFQEHLVMPSVNSLTKVKEEERKESKLYKMIISIGTRILLKKRNKTNKSKLINLMVVVEHKKVS